MPRFFKPLADFRLSDLPAPPRSFWTLAGPGAVLVGLSIGAGEIIIWPRAVAQHGAGMVWAALVGVFLQLWVNVEIGRWTVATGETVYTGFARVWRGFGPMFIAFNVLGWLIPGWAQASGSALKALLVGPDFGRGTFWGSLTCWTIVTFGIAAALLFGPKMVYHSVEKTIEVLVVIVTLGMVSVALTVGTADNWRELAHGAVNIGHRPPQVSARELFIWIVFAGAGGTANLFYTFYLRDKNFGMGAQVPDLENPLRGRNETIPATGFRFSDTPENRHRFAAWLGYVRKDQVLFFWLLNTFTLLLFIFGALAVLRPLGELPNEGTLIWDQSKILSHAWGKWGAVGEKLGQIVFLMVGVATLFSTQLALVDGVSRSISDILYTNFAWAQRRPVSWWYMAIALGWMVVGCVLTWSMEHFGFKDRELGVLFQAAYMGGFAMAVYVPLTLYINLRYLPAAARPGIGSIVMMLIASAVYIGFAVSSLLS
ncbi:MAG TPA: Nramp family divalent metal transporter [Pirellulales bacterium]|nr:Nramp family divalent metal transporter [Pirellulales bacterium]